MADRFETARFIVNRSAGRHQTDLAGILEGAVVGRTQFDIRHTEHPGHAEELARAAVEEGTGLVIAVGGDGTVNEVCRALLNTAAVLGVIPTGSGNAFARTLGLPLRHRDACLFLSADPVSDPRTIDAGMIDGHCFLTTAGIGIDALTCWIYANRPGKSRRGLWPYLSAAFQASRRFQPGEVTITVDDETPLRLTPGLLTIANGDQFGYGAVIAPGALMDDGELDLRVVGPRHALRLLWESRRLFTGSIDGLSDLGRMQGRTIRIERSQPGPIQADGEVFEAPAVLEVQVVPAALQVMAPG